MQVIRKADQYDALQWVGNNKPACDEQVGERSTRRGDTLTYQTVIGRHKIAKNDWLVSFQNETTSYTNREFNAQYIKTP